MHVRYQRIGLTLALSMLLSVDRVAGLPATLVADRMYLKVPKRRITL